MTTKDEATRRQLLRGIGAGLALSALPCAALAAAPLPSLEEIFGARRFAVLRAMFRTNFGSLTSDWKEHSVLEPGDRFRASTPVRAGLAAFVLHHTPFEHEASLDTEQGIADLATISIFRRALLVPPDDRYELIARDSSILWRHWTGENGWRRAGWPAPKRARSGRMVHWPQLADPPDVPAAYFTSASASPRLA